MSGSVLQGEGDISTVKSDPGEEMSWPSNSWAAQRQQKTQQPTPSATSDQSGSRPARIGPSPLPRLGGTPLVLLICGVYCWSWPFTLVKAQSSSLTSLTTAFCFPTDLKARNICSPNFRVWFPLACYNAIWLRDIRYSVHIYEVMILFVAKWKANYVKDMAVQLCFHCFSLLPCSRSSIKKKKVLRRRTGQLQPGNT